LQLCFLGSRSPSSSSSGRKPASELPGRDVLVVAFKTPEYAAQLEILFISDRATNYLRSILSQDVLQGLDRKKTFAITNQTIVFLSDQEHSVLLGTSKRAWDGGTADSHFDSQGDELPWTVTDGRVVHGCRPATTATSSIALSGCSMRSCTFPPDTPEMVWCSGSQQASWPFATAKVESSPNMESIRIRGAFKPLRFLACQRCRRPDRGTIVQIVAVAYRRALASVSATADVRRAASAAFADVSRSVC
jgi:hypothetical protein